MRLARAVPALPVRDVAAAVDAYATRFAFSTHHVSDDFARLVRDDVEIDLWLADDTRRRIDPRDPGNPVVSGAETFLAGTASCRIEVDDVDALHAELSAAGVLHPTDAGSPIDTGWGTREFATLDLDGNLLTFYRPPLTAGA